MRLKNILLCDAATVHPDNTFSLLRGGVDRFTIPNLNSSVKLALIATIELDISERGRLHNAELSLLDMDGARVLPPLAFHFQVPPGNTKHKHNLVCDLVIKFNKFGEHCFYVNVDGQELGTHSVYVVQGSVPIQPPQ